jgi:hypothetical protein
MAIYNQQQLTSASVATYFTNVYGGISASAVRDLNYNWISSSALLTGSQTFNGTQTIKSSGGTPLIVDHSDASPTQNTLIAILKSGSAAWSIGNQGTDDSFIVYNPQTFAIPLAIRQDNSVNIEGSLTASLQTGYVWIGNGSGKTQAVATSSIIANTDTGSLMVTGSVSGNTLTFTKGNASQFSLTVATGSTPNTGSFLTTASFASTNITFTKGDGTQFDLPGFATTGSNTFYGDQSITGSLSANIPTAKQFRINWAGAGSSASMYTDESSGPNQSLVINSASLYLNRGGLYMTSGSFTSQIGDMQFNALPSASFTIRTTYGGNAILRANTDFTDGNRNYSYFQASPDGQISIVGKGDAVIITGSLGTTIQGLKYPSTDGTAGQVLTTDGSKNLTFTSITASATINTGSLLVTASFDNTTRDITFTKGDATTFKLGGFATTGSNTFTGNQTIVPASGIAITISGSTGFGYGIRLQGQQGISLEGSGGPRISFPNASWMNGNENDDFQFTGDTTNPLTRGMSFYLYGTGSRQMQFRNDSGPSANMAFQLNSGSMTFNAGSSISITGSSLTMQGFTYPTTDGTSGQALVTNGSKTLSFATVSINTGSFATTGSNSFRGVENIGDIPGTGAGEVYLLGRSGSLILGNSTATPTYAALAHLSSSQVNANTNLIFKTTTTAADTIISGSSNIFTNPAAATAGFKRYIGGSGNLMLSPNAINQISASQAFPITMAFNLHGNTSITTRGPVSASAWTIQNNLLIGPINIGQNAANNAEKILGNATITANQVGQPLNIIANRTPISASTSISSNALIGGTTTLTMASSSIGYQSNVGNATITNGFQNVNAAATSVNNSLQVQQNWLGATLINVSGSDAGGVDNPRAMLSNLLFQGFNLNNIGGANLSLNGSGSSMLSTMMMGHELGITGSNGYDSNNGILQPGIGAGSAFFGRWNAQNGNRARTAETVFAIGTGTSTSLTKTGFLIDSGSNTFIEGTLNVSGSTAMNGSQTITGSLAVSSFTTLASVSSSLNFADDTAAAAGGVPLGGLYRNGNFVMIRLT